MITYGYVRVSTARQSATGESLDVQNRKIEGYAKMEGLEVSKVFVERGISGGRPLDDRPQGAAMLKALQDGDAIICPKLDRMFRSASDALTVCEQFKKRKVSLHLLDLGGNVTDNGGTGVSQMVFTILAAVAQFERERIGERVAETKANLKSQGRAYGGSIPFGYRKEGKMLLPEPKEQEAIKLMKRRRKAGKSYRVIAEEVSNKLGRSVAHTTVKRVLSEGSK